MSHTISNGVGMAPSTSSFDSTESKLPAYTGGGTDEVNFVTRADLYQGFGRVSGIEQKDVPRASRVLYTTFVYW